MARKHGITATTYSNLILDSGALYTGTFTDISAPGTLIGATRGGSTFSIEQEVKEMEVDGALGPVKGSRRITKVTTKLTCNLIEASSDAISQAIVASSVAEDTPAGWDSVSRGTSIADADYIDNVALIAQVSGKTNAMGIVLSNALVDQSFELAFADKEETVIPITFTAHFLSNALDTEPWLIQYPAT